MKPQLLVLSGLPGSGKSTQAKTWQQEDPDARIIVNYDAMRLARFGPDWRWNRKDEDEVKAAARTTVETALKAGISVCIDNTNLSRHVRESWKQLGLSLGAEVIEEEMGTSLLECISRDRARGVREPAWWCAGCKERKVPGNILHRMVDGHCDGCGTKLSQVGGRVGRAVIERMALLYGFLDFSVKECNCPQKDSNDGHHFRSCACIAKQVVLVDIDGTIADCSHRLHHIKPEDDGRWHKMDCSLMGWTRARDGVDLMRACRECGYKQSKDWAAFSREAINDTPIQGIVSLVEMLSRRYTIILLSGRDTSIGIETEDWLDRHIITYNHLFLRQAGDHRPDVEYKMEILNFIPVERIAYVIEDRDRCVEAYRANGLTVLQPAKGGY